MSHLSRPEPADSPAPAAIDRDRVRADLDQETRLVAEAILLVSSGGSRRVTVAGLHFPEQVLAASRPLAVAGRVRLVALWTDDEGGADVAVEALGAGGR